MSDQRQTGRPLPVPVYGDGSDVWAFLEDRADRRARNLPLGVPTPFKALDDFLVGGWQPGEVYVIGAPPSTGKSALAGRIARHVSALRGRALYLSYEIDPAKIRMRALADVAGMRYELLQGGRVNVPELRERFAVDLALQTSGIGMLDCTQHRPTLDEIELISAQTFAGIADQAANLTPYNSLVIVDYLQLAARAAARSGGTAGDDVRVQVADFSNRMMTLARRLGVAVIQLASVNRASYARRDRSDEGGRSDHLADMAAFKEAGDIESDVDNAMLITLANPNDSWQSVRSDDVWNLKLHIMKARNGKTGAIPLQFNRPFLRFSSEGE